MTDTETLAAVRQYAVDLVAADDMSVWGTHEGYKVGTDLLKLIDNKPDGTWDSRRSDWYVPLATA